MTAVLLKCIHRVVPKSRSGKFSVLISGCKSTAPSENGHDDGNATAGNCSEPENPFDEGSGHYAGFDWAERTGSKRCGSNPQSFIEGS